MLPATARLPGVMPLIRQQNYFVLHAPRQTGKTTALLTLAQELTAEGTYTAVLVSMEAGAPYGDDPGAAEDAIPEKLASAQPLAASADLQFLPAWPDEFSRGSYSVSTANLGPQHRPARLCCFSTK